MDVLDGFNVSVDGIVNGTARLQLGPTFLVARSFVSVPQATTASLGVSEKFVNNVVPGRSIVGYIVTVEYRGVRYTSAWIVDEFIYAVTRAINGRVGFTRYTVNRVTTEALRGLISG